MDRVRSRRTSTSAHHEPLRMRQFRTHKRTDPILIHWVFVCDLDFSRQPSYETVSVNAALEQMDPCPADEMFGIFGNCVTSLGKNTRDPAPESRLRGTANHALRT